MRSGGIFGNFVSLGTGEVVARVVAFVATTYLTRTLGPEGFGILGFAAALCGYAALAVRAGFDDVGARDVARQPERTAEIAAGATLVRLLLAAGAMLIVLLVAAMLPKAPVVRLVVVLTGLSFFSLALDAGWIYKGLGRNARVGAALVAGQVLYVAIVVATVRGPEDIIKVPLAQVAGELGAAALLLVPLLRRGIRPDIREGITILRASGFVTLTRLLRTLIFTFDVVLIGLWLGEHQVGLYAAAYRFCFLVLAVAAGLHVAYLPAFARTTGAQERRRLAGRAVELSSALSIPMVVGGSLLAGRILQTTFGPAYGEAAAAFRLLLLSIAFIFQYGMIHNLLLVLGRTRIETQIVALAAGLNVGLNFLAIPQFGLVGAAFTTALAEGVIVVLGLLVLSHAGVRPSFRSVTRPAIAAGVMAVGLLAAGPEWPLSVSLFGGAALYAGTLVVLRAVPADVVAAFAPPQATDPR